MRLTAPDKLIAPAAAVLLFLLYCSAGCGDSPVSQASSSKSISRSTAKSASNPPADQKPVSDTNSEQPTSTTQPKPAVLVEEPPAAAPKGRARNISFDTIKFEMEKRDRFVKSMLTPTINSLDRKRVKIRGFMFPTSMRAGIASFILVRDNQECCFGPGAALFDALAVQMRSGETTEYAYFPITVEGVFRIDPIENPLYGEGPLENSHLYVFRMEDALVTKR